MDPPLSESTPGAAPHWKEAAGDTLHQRTLPWASALVADDVQDSANALKALLGAHGHEVTTVYDGAKALSSTVYARPDVIILDLQMPGLNGFDVCRAIRRHDWGKKMLVIAHTGWARDEDIKRAKDAGCDLHLAKPMKIEELLGALRRAELQRMIQ